MTACYCENIGRHCKCQIQSDALARDPPSPLQQLDVAHPLLPGGSLRRSLFD